MQREIPHQETMTRMLKQIDLLKKQIKKKQAKLFARPLKVQYSSCVS